MRQKWFFKIVLVLLIVGVGGAVLAQRGGRGGGGRGGGGRGGGGFRGEGGGRIMSPLDRGGTPSWEVDKNFKSDVFTFVRIQYDSYGGRGGGGGWSIDYPDGDINFPFRLQQMTSMKVDPNPIVLRLTDEELFNYPFIYMLEIGSLVFSEAEVEALRRYCLNGGFLLVDDHWGIAEYQNFRREILRVFPGNEPQELPLEHPIFHCVFDLKEKPQLPSINVARRWRGTNRTWEDDSDPLPHYRAIYDERGRMMVIICSNTDLGDGWEREGEEEWYFREFSEKKAYPMGINIVFYAMTH